jgi:tRNA A-37 threonylcarbamoyl transferase component Bud32/ketosteroid isomerase-like protein
VIDVEIHGYRVERALVEDKGGFGDVYVARHTTSGAEAVLKVLKPELSSHKEIVTRFFNEARAAAAIQHPGIVAVHNVGYVQDRAYLLMERLRGEDLEARLRRGPLPLDRALRFVRQAAGAVGAAHGAGIVHRDLKPANLFVVPDPEVIGGERIKVLDFGIAKLGTAGTMQTQGVFGTPAYMSPEQCSSAADVDARSDLYALGCILFEMVAGRPPFGHGGLELVAAHLRDPAPPLGKFVAGVPAPLEALVARLLRKDRAERPASCAELVAALYAIAAAPQAAPSAPPALGLAPTAPPADPLAPTAPPAAAAPSAPPTARSRALGGKGVVVGAAVAAGVAAVAGVILVERGGDPPAETAGKVASAPPPAARPDAAPAPARAPAPPSPDRVVATYRGCLDAFRDGAADALRACYTPDALAPPSTERGADPVLADAAALQTAFKGLNVAPQLVLVSGTHVASISTMAGAFMGPLATPMGTAAADQHTFALRRADVADLDPSGARIARRWNVVDHLELLGQLHQVEDKVRDPIPLLVDTQIVEARGDDTEKANVGHIEDAVDAFNRRDEKTLVALLADDVRWSSESDEQDGDRAAMLEHLHAFWHDVTEARLDADVTWGAGDYVVSAGVVTTRTDKVARTAYVLIARLDHGRIVEWTDFADTLDTWRQLDTLPKLIKAAPAPTPHPARHDGRPTTALGSAAATGDLDKGVIRRYIYRYAQRIQYCYEKALVSSPGLEGTVTTQFTISGNGTVVAASAKGVSADVANCVADVIKGIEFPKPAGGGIVNVTFPFTFHPSGE